MKRVANDDSRDRMREVCEQKQKKNKNEAKRPVKTNLASADESNVCEYDAKIPRT